MTIGVAGPHSLDAMVDLCRQGFSRVECARQATCACADETSDILLIESAASEALGPLVARTIRLLRDGGVVAARLRSTKDQRLLATGIAAAGFHILGCANDGPHLAAFTVARAHALPMAS